jgi:hypothetical protein
VGGDNRLKPALRLMTDYRLMIEEIQDAEVITSYTRWVEAVQANFRQRALDVAIAEIMRRRTYKLHSRRWDDQNIGG